MVLLVCKDGVFRAVATFLEFANFDLIQEAGPLDKRLDLKRLQLVMLDNRLDEFFDEPLTAHAKPGSGSQATYYRARLLPIRMGLRAVGISLASSSRPGRLRGERTH
jgi:hypothetical protein